ncbi:hypothetical protein ACSBPU_13280 [Parapusillimonas sp. JC17]|uniref:hypothetical protein n=1 Tax=Parapusillimonas sp. JC17 TaxID=3445768 RepID=UPI003FA19172
MNKTFNKARTATRSVSVAARKLERWDRTRPDFPGEHLIVALAGIALLVAAGRTRTPMRSMLLTAAGTAALGRAANGRGGLARVASWLVGK